MLTIKTGNSTNANAAAAGREVALQVKEDLDNMKMAFVYSGVQYDQKEFIDAISAELPGVPLIGNTSFTGVMTPDVSSPVKTDSPASWQSPTTN